MDMCKTVCQLCRKASELCESHIVPNWVFNDELRDRMKGGRFVDLSDNRYCNKALTCELLCNSCEALFGQWERPAKELSRASACGTNYGPWLLKFATSISWRVVTWFQLRQPTENGDAIREVLQQPHVGRALDVWRDFLLNGTLDRTKSHRQHLFMVAPDYPIRNAICITLGSAGEHTFVWSRFGFFGILGVLHSNKPNQLDKSVINVRGGSIPFFGVMPSAVLRFLAGIEADGIALAQSFFRVCV